MVHHLKPSHTIPFFSLSYSVPLFLSLSLSRLVSYREEKRRGESCHDRRRPDSKLCLSNYSLKVKKGTKEDIAFEEGGSEFFVYSHFLCLSLFSRFLTLKVRIFTWVSTSISLSLLNYLSINSSSREKILHTHEKRMDCRLRHKDRTRTWS